MADVLNMKSPPGFRESLQCCGNVGSDLFYKICSQVLDYQQLKSSHLPFNEYHQELGDDGEKMEKIIRAVSFIYRYRNDGLYLYFHKIFKHGIFLILLGVEEKLTSEGLESSVRSAGILPEDQIKIISQVWREQGKQLLISSLVKDINVGKLLDIKWKLGLAVSSSECKQLNSPYVTMVITVVDQSGRSKNHSVEMTIKQFKNFSQQLQEMDLLLNAV